RLGWGEHGIDDIKSDPYFDTIDWNMVQQRQLTPPYTPTITSEEDVSNFDESFT
ncbi:hypothetical protein BDF20DRAFT_791228, partial [Mycotypha africana]|uniref:uncharacterized protein n=1 Tax=Mycotypha africana TaxID=64632 RepID=UPI002300902C